MRDLEILDLMNREDTDNGTETVGICPDMVELKKAKGGAHITFGIPESEMYRIMDGKVMGIVVLIDRETYLKHKKG